MKYLRHWFILLLLWLSYSCTSKYNNAIEAVLDNVSNKQANDLEAVLNHYTNPQDSLKRKAAHFLVENFPEDQYQTIDKQLLIENIELAFQVWKKPWAKQLNFEEFKELVLPFDLERDSTGTFWRKRFINEYAFVEDSLKNNPDKNPILAVCKVVDQVLRKKYTIRFIDNEPSVLNLNEWERLKQGDCSAMAYLTNHIMHAIGIPTAIEFTPRWANSHASHYWSVVYINHHLIPFAGGENLPQTLKVEHVRDEMSSYIRKRAKVFRKMYAFNPNSLAALSAEPIPAKFRDSHIIDVSKLCLPTRSVAIEVPDSQTSEYVYLSVFSYGKNNWQPVNWAKNQGSKVTFTDMRTEAVYIPSSYQQDSIFTFDYPFILKKDGQKHLLKPQLTTRETITCTKKYLRDMTNLIKIGDVYQLFFWDKNGWVSVGTQIAKEKMITFENVPQNALLLLRDLTRGKQERIFTYTNNQQVFW